MDQIVVPTLGRINMQFTYECLPRRYKEKVLFVVQDHEFDEMNDRYSGRVLRLPRSITKISPTRQWIWDEFYGSKFMTMDDDLKKFVCKRPATAADNATSRWITRPMDDQDFDEAFGLFESWMEEGIHFGGFCTSWIVPDRRLWPTHTIVRMMTNSYFNSSFLPRDIVWDRLEFSSDFDTTLQLLTRGYPNRVSTKFRVQVAPTNAPGGCSIYRTVEKINRTHLQLQELFPEYVSVNERVRTSGPLAGQRYMSCLIQWARAFRHGSNN
ncbi:hypothetical protein NKDENANG_01051 [Candidatus Entotheonellaceae bacterium PAL068K]